jgi:5-methylthioribose kinase
VEQDWFCTRERIWREAGAMRMLAPYLPSGSVPAILAEDRDSHWFAMEAAPADAQPWKTPLLAGHIEPSHARRAGTLMATWIRESLAHPEWQDQFSDLSVFDDLRLDPYYRSTAARHPNLAPAFDRLIHHGTTRRVALVHGDFSPKNLLVTEESMMVIDWEVVHWGDPAFDAAFLTNHLALKAFHQPQNSRGLAGLTREFWIELRRGLPHGFEWMEGAAMEHLGGLMLARIDGKSPAEYIRDDFTRNRVRETATRLLTSPVRDLEHLMEREWLWP